MWHLLMYGHLRDREFLGTYTFLDHQAWSTYCVDCQPERRGTETMQTFLAKSGGNY